MIAIPFTFKVDFTSAGSRELSETARFNVKDILQLLFLRKDVTEYERELICLAGEKPLHKADFQKFQKHVLRNYRSRNIFNFDLTDWKEILADNVCCIAYEVLSIAAGCQSVSTDPINRTFFVNETPSKQDLKTLYKARAVHNALRARCSNAVVTLKDRNIRELTYHDARLCKAVFFRYRQRGFALTMRRDKAGALLYALLSEKHPAYVHIERVCHELVSSSERRDLYSYTDQI